MSELLSSIMASEKPVVPELPEMGDPFMEMLFVIHVMMPEVLNLKQYELAQLGMTMESLAIYQNKLSYAQDLLNDFFSEELTHEEMISKGQDIIDALEELRDLVENEDVIDGSADDEDSLKGEVLSSLDRFISDTYADGRSPGDYFNNLAYHTPQRTEWGSHYRPELKKRLDDMNITGTAFRSTSAQTQMLFDYDTQDYNAWVGLTDSMLRNMIEQVGAPIREGLNT